MDRLLDVLTGLVPLPPTRFVSHEGHVDDESWERLLEALRSNREAVGVRLRSCGLGCVHASQLAEVLASNAVLEVLELPDNVISERGVHALVDTLRLSNCTLKSVDLSGNPCYERAAHAMQELDTLLKRNRVIKKLPKTPPTAGVGGRAAPGNLSSRSATCTPTNGLSTPQLAQPFLATTCAHCMTPHGLSLELEQRLQHLEEAEATIRSELEHVRSFSSQSEMWQKKIDAAGQQIAAILSLVDSRNLTLEARLQTMEHWRGGAEQAWAGQNKVMEDMAAQILGLMRRVQLLEGQMALARADAASRASTGPVPVVASSLVHAPNAATMWLEMVALRERLAKLEAASTRAALPLDGARKASTSGEHEYAGASEQRQQQQSQHGREAGGVGEAAAQQAPLSASTSELSSLDDLSPALDKEDPVEDATGSAAAGAAPTVGATDGRGSGAGAAAVAKQQQPQLPRPMEAAVDIDLDSSGLQGRRGAGVQPLEVHGSPILWHVNTFAVCPGSCGITPIHEHVVSDAAATAAALPAYMRERGDGKAVPPPASVDAAPSSSSCSAGSSVSADAAGDLLPAEADTGGCSGFVMYAAAPRAATQRYGPPQEPDADARDSVDFSAHLRASQPAAARAAAADGGNDGSSTPGRIGGATSASPGTPPGSTFSVDAETVSLSVAMAGSAARPRAPAAAATTSDTPILAHASSTKDSLEAEVNCEAAACSSGTTEEPLPGAASATAAGCSRALKHSVAAASTTEAALAGLPAGGNPGLPSPTATAVRAQADSVGTPGVSVRQWADAVGASASGAAASVGSLTPTSKPCPAAAASTTPEAAATPSAHAAGAARPGLIPHLSSPSPNAAAVRRPAAATRGAPRPGADLHRSAAADARVALQSPSGCEGHGSASRPHHAAHPHHHPPHPQPGATGASTATATTSVSRQRESASPDAAARTSAMTAGRDATHPHAAADELAVAAAARASGHEHSARSNIGGGGGGATSGGHPPHHPAGPLHAAGGAGPASGHTPRSWLPGRASVQSHSIRSLAGRGDSGAGHSGKPVGAAPAGRISSACAKPGIGGLHRPTSSTNSTAAPAAAASAAPSRSASLGAVAAAAHEHTLRHAAGHHRNGKFEAGADPTAAVTAAVPASDGEASHQGLNAQLQPGPAAAAATAPDAAQQVLEPSTKDQQHRHATSCGADSRDAAHAQAAAADGAAAALHPQQQHSSRGYRPGGAATARTLASGTAGNVAGPVAKGGGLARTSMRNVVGSTSVAGATKRWM